MIGLAAAAILLAPTSAPADRSQSPDVTATRAAGALRRVGVED